jgi:hypothetical protein
MRRLKLIPILSIILALGSHSIFLSSQAYGWGCCRNCPCSGACNCPGTGGCPWFPCATDDDSPTLQAQTVTINEELDITGSYASSPAPAFRSHSIDRLISRTSSDKCNKNNFALKLFQTAEDKLMFEPDFLKYNVSEDNDIVVSQAY